MSETLDRNHDSTEFDALAELFLGDDDAEAHQAPAVRPPVSDARANGHHADVVGSIGLADASSPATYVEALVIGHLPVRTGPWLSQYAAATAKADGLPVALLRITETEIRVDLVGAPLSARPTPLESLEDAIGVAGAQAGRWMIQIGDLDVPWLLHSPLVDAITLLAGANEAALVDAYRTIKSLVAGSPGDEGKIEHAEAGIPAIRLAIMGADEDRARGVADRLRDASRAFLGREIELAAGVREMGPTNAAPLFLGRSELDIRAILDRLRRGSRSRPIPSVPTQPRPQAPAPIDDKAPDAGAPHTNAPPPAGEAPRARRAIDWSEAEPAAMPLAPHLDSLTSLPIPYPDDPGVQFAIDGTARLHILRMDDDESGAGVSALTAAGAWAVRHQALLNMAIRPSGPIPADGAPVLHLFTRRPKALRPLLDAEIRLHALAPVPRDRDWVSLDLN